MKKTEALQHAKTLKDKLLQKGYPIRGVYLFGSFAKGTPHEWSDIDVAVVCDPFETTKHRESMKFWEARRDIDVRIEPVCLHPEDFENRYFTLAKEVERYGIEV